MYRRCRRCNCMYNCNENQADMFEQRCRDVVSPAEYNENCDCGFDYQYTGFPEDPMYGQSYVPVQQMNEVFKPNIGLSKGTIYPELVSPYSPGQSMEEINYLETSNVIGEGCNKCQ